ncbi:MAG: hypothetical protein WAT39_19680 [Planctomycetota bacterium]
MRGGPFSETRVIDLLNHRFVPFFFNTGGPGEGHDDDAKDFVLGKVPNRWAYFAAFAPDGNMLGQTAIYDGTAEVFAWLRALLRRYPEYDKPTADEAAMLTTAATALTADAALAVARGCERIARYPEAKRAWQRLLGVGDAEQRAAAHCGLLRIARADGDWPAHAEALAAARASAEAGTLATDLVIEHGLRLLAERRPASARVTLQSAIAGAAASPRLAELHYEAGRACWFLGDRDQAKAHWCWILEQRPDDRMAQRARLAAGAEAFPYPNGELGDFQPKVGPVGPGALDGGVRAAQRIYQRRRGKLLANEFDLEAAQQAAVAEAPVELARSAPPQVDPVDAPDSLVARLSAASDSAVTATLVDRIVAAGAAAAQPLMVAAGNENFRGRLAAVTAIGQLVTAHPSIDQEQRGWFRRALVPLTREAGDLAAAASAALAAVESAATRPAGDDGNSAPAEPTRQPGLPKGAFALVASLRDGNEHRVANNRVVEALAALGETAVLPLQAAVADHEFTGRGYAAFALGKVLSTLATRPAAAFEALQAAARDDEPYVAALAKSGLALLK